MAKYLNPAHVVHDPGKNYTGYAAGAAIRGRRFLSVKAGGRPTRPYVGEATATAAVVGVSKYDADANDEVGVITGGLVEMVAGGTVAEGDYLKSDAEGRAIKTAAATDNYNAIAYTAATVGNSVYVQLSL
jgi:Uncharacterized conserved protein (DUF2190)